MSDSEQKVESNVEETEPEAQEETEDEKKESQHNIEKAEEQKLRSKYPPITGRPMASGHSAFLQKRLAKGQKYFDSGDYQMAKQKPLSKTRMQMPPLLSHSTGDAIPTPESVPIRKTSIIQHNKLTSAS
ncbi:unnamed protein product [Meganyctiphanes norvegica]|uniref:Alpha-endosulfine n=1 Tax=Meganyctiphanes norvegica TaxID=48144 RepID=A0AAV2SKR0_MEGNR